MVRPTVSGASEKLRAVWLQFCAKKTHAEGQEKVFFSIFRYFYAPSSDTCNTYSRTQTNRTHNTINAHAINHCQFMVHWTRPHSFQFVRGVYVGERGNPAIATVPIDRATDRTADQPMTTAANSIMVVVASTKKKTKKRTHTQNRKNRKKPHLQ